MQNGVKQLGRYQWCKILTATALSAAVALVLLTGWMSAGQHQHISKHEVSQGAIKVALEDWEGLNVGIGELISYAIPCMSFTCMLLKAHAWHLWRMLFGWLKHKSYRTCSAGSQVLDSVWMASSYECSVLGEFIAQ